MATTDLDILPINFDPSVRNINENVIDLKSQFENDENSKERIYLYYIFFT